jgi:spermidine/putrescine transport system substrate-binding protein
VRSPRSSPARPTPSRRDVLRGVGATGLLALLAACGDDDDGGGPAAPTDRSDAEKVVNWANWPQSLDYDARTKTFPTLETFQSTADTTATYDEVIEDNESYYAQIEPSLRRGQDFGKDLVVLTDWMAARMIRNGYAQRLNHSIIRHADNLLPRLRDSDSDPGRSFSLTWQSGYTGVAYRRGLDGGPVRTVSDLWRKDLRGRVEVLSEMRDTMGLIMLQDGADVSDRFTADQFSQALQTLDQQLGSGQIRQVRGSSYLDDLVAGDCDACIAWSGDIAQLNRRHGNRWEFVRPEAGAILWSHDLLVPIGSPHRKNAEILMNYYYEPTVAAKVAAYVNYICPVQGAQDAMVQVAPELVEDPLIFPGDDDLRRAKVFRTLTAAEEDTYAAQFAQVLGA